MYMNQLEDPRVILTALESDFFILAMAPNARTLEDLANENACRKSVELITSRSRYMKPAPSVGKHMLPIGSLKKGRFVFKPITNFSKARAKQSEPHYRQ